MENVIKVKEARLEIMPTAANRVELHKVQDGLKRFMKIEEEF